MDAVAIPEFPFVAALPKREKSKLAKAWDLMRQIRHYTDEDGSLVPVMLAAKCLDLSRSRIDSICADGRLRRVEIDGHVFITENSILEFGAMERKNGRPLKAPTLAETWAESRKFGSEVVQSASKKS